MYIIRFERILKSRSENSEKLGKDLSNYDLSSGSRKTLLQAWKTLKIAFFLPTSFSDNHGQKSWDTFAFLGRFPIHTGPTPPLTPQTMLDVCIQNFFRVSTLYRVGGGRTARTFRKRCTGNREVTEKYEYCSTVQRTFVQDCSNEIWTGAGREKQYCRITFPPKKKRIYCHSLENCPPITTMLLKTRDNVSKSETLALIKKVPLTKIEPILPLFFFYFPPYFFSISSLFFLYF